jgi:DNA polymerase-3 subunit beta
LAATDSFRLGETTLFLPQDSFIEKEVSLILPQRASREIVNIFSDFDKNLKIYLNPSQFSIETEMEETPHPEIIFISRLIEGEFPDYQTIIPKKFNLETIFVKEDFLKQIKAASVFSPKNNEVKLKFNPQNAEVEIASENPEFGSYSSFLKGKIEGKPFTISFNYRFLLEGVEQIDSKEFSLQITNEEGPALIKSTEKEDFLYILMPIKTI